MQRLYNVLLSGTTEEGVCDVSHDVPPRRSFSKLDPDDQGFVALEKLSSLISDLGDAVPQTDEVNHHTFLSHKLTSILLILVP